MRLVFIKDTELHKKSSVVEVRDDLAIEYLNNKEAKVVGRSEQQKDKVEKATSKKSVTKAGGE